MVTIEVWAPGGAHWDGSAGDSAAEIAALVDLAGAHMASMPPGAIARLGASGGTWQAMAPLARRHGIGEGPASADRWKAPDLLRYRRPGAGFPGTPRAVGDGKVKIEIVVTSDFGILSRGRHSARLGSGGSVQWASKNAKGQLVITEPGQWQLHCTDGFGRTAKAVLTVTADGDWEMTGDTRRFDVVE